MWVAAALTGRRGELAELARAATGAFGCVVVLGEPGVGKSRLVREFVERHAATVRR